MNLIEKCKGFTFIYIKSINKNIYHALLYFKIRRKYTNVANFSLEISGKTYIPNLHDKIYTKKDANKFV